jgi:hypothetical protein
VLTHPLELSLEVLLLFLLLPLLLWMLLYCVAPRLVAVGLPWAHPPHPYKFARFQVLNTAAAAAAAALLLC